MASGTPQPDKHIATAGRHGRCRCLKLPIAVWEAMQLAPGCIVAVAMIGEKAILERVPLENLAKLDRRNPAQREALP